MGKGNRQMMQQGKKNYVILWMLCLVGSWSVIPYIWYLGIVPSSASILSILLLGTFQAALFYGLICALSYKLLPKTDLEPFSNKNSLKKIIFLGVISGIAVGLVLYFLEKMIFPTSLLASGGMRLPLWTGALASLYGGINEEVLLRLFLFTLVYFLFGKIFKFANQNRVRFLWITNAIVAIIFGLGHLPALFKLITPSSFEIFRVLLLNGIPGIVFGWLYWSKGLWTAMISHFVADLMIHAFLR
jgi:membrane protease YdiL (CAAX protease family)